MHSIKRVCVFLCLGEILVKIFLYFQFHQTDITLGLVSLFSLTKGSENLQTIHKKMASLHSRWGKKWGLSLIHNLRSYYHIWSVFAIDSNRT